MERVRLAPALSGACSSWRYDSDPQRDNELSVASQGGQAVIQPPEIEFMVHIFATDQLPPECRRRFYPEAILGSNVVEGLPIPLPTDCY